MKLNLFTQACRDDDLNTIKRLLSEGYAIDQPDADGQTGLIMASWRGHDGVVQYLIAHGADVNQGTTDSQWKPLAAASERSHLKVMRTLIEHHADINGACINGWTPLIEAAAKGQIGASCVLLDFGCDMNLRTNRDYSAIMTAANAGAFDVFRELYSRGACTATHSASRDIMDITHASIQSEVTHLFRVTAAHQSAQNAITEINAMKQPQGLALTPR